MIAHFNEIETEKFMSVIRKRESSNNYAAVNSLGFLGAYQFGWMALADLGFVKMKPRGIKMKPFLETPSSWIHPDVHSQKDFLENKEVQDEAFIKHTNRNFKTLVKLTDLENMSKSEIAGWLCVAHLLGAGSAVKLIKGDKSGMSQDAYGTKWEEYYKMGKKAFS